ALIFSYQAEPQVLTVACVGERSLPLARRIGLVERVQIDVDQNALGRCVRGELVYEPALEHPDLPFPARLVSGGMRALVAAPLTIESEIFGVLVVASRVENSFTSDDCEFLRQLSSHVALAANQARLYDALQVAYQDLRQTQQTVMQQERLRALGQIASGIAHDINNALSPAALYTQSLLSHEGSLTQRSREHLAVIQRAIEDVAQTVQRMRAFYMPRGLWSNMAQEKGIVVEVIQELSPDLPKVLGAESEVRDALTNLMLNAV